jgi:hypothetical protein
MLVTKEAFGSCRLHLEWWSPQLPAEVRGQKRSNSGVFLTGRYEVQILESFDSTQTYADGLAGALYGQFPPPPLPHRTPALTQKPFSFPPLCRLTPPTQHEPPRFR